MPHRRRPTSASYNRTGTAGLFLDIFAGSCFTLSPA